MILPVRGRGRGSKSNEKKKEKKIGNYLEVLMQCIAFVRPI